MILESVLYFFLQLLEKDIKLKQSLRVLLLALEPHIIIKML